MEITVGIVASDSDDDSSRIGSSGIDGNIATYASAVVRSIISYRSGSVSVGVVGDVG